MTQALKAENIHAGLLFHPAGGDYHIYAHWTPIVEKRAWALDRGQ